MELLRACPEVKLHSQVEFLFRVMGTLQVDRWRLHNIMHVLNANELFTLRRTQDVPPLSTVTLVWAHAPAPTCSLFSPLGPQASGLPKHSHGPDSGPEHGPAEHGHRVHANELPHVGAVTAPQQGHDVWPHVVHVLLPEVLVGDGCGRSLRDSHQCLPKTRGWRRKGWWWGGVHPKCKWQFLSYGVLGIGAGDSRWVLSTLEPWPQEDPPTWNSGLTMASLRLPPTVTGRHLP